MIIIKKRESFNIKSDIEGRRSYDKRWWDEWMLQMNLVTLEWVVLVIYLRKIT